MLSCCQVVGLSGCHVVRLSCCQVVRLSGCHVDVCLMSVCSQEYYYYCQNKFVPIISAICLFDV